MGCGSSSLPNPKHSIRQDSAQQHQATLSYIPPKPAYNVNGNITEKTSPIKVNVSTAEVPKAIKLEFKFEETNTIADLPERILKLKQDSKHELTEQMLIEKQKLADLRHRKQLELRAENSHKGKLRREIIAAREFEKAQKQYVEIENSLDTAGSKRSKLITDKIAKIKQREAHAKQVRERAKKSDVLDDSSFDSFEEPVKIEHDKSYNRDTIDNSWDEMNDSSFLQPDFLESDGPGSVITM